MGGALAEQVQHRPEDAVDRRHFETVGVLLRRHGVEVPE
jgi:hypothetical protein